MKNRKRLSLLLFISTLMVILTSCYPEKNEIKSPYPSDYFAMEILKIEKADVTVDVNMSVSKGDYRFLVCIGWGPIAPGIAQDDSKILKYGTRIIDGTGDMIFSEDHERYKKAAAEYAAKYNTLLLEKILEFEKKKQTHTINESNHEKH